jgi:acyl-CoA synthetase (AMP-forming)/AMP-acid ligase II
MKSKLKFLSILDMINHQNQNSIALIFDDNGAIKKLTFRDINNLISTASLSLDKKCVGIFCDGSLNCLIKIMAYLNKGISIVLLNPLDNSFLIQDEIFSIGCDGLEGPKELINSFKLGNSSKVPQGKIFFFTSGTTSKAKAVILTEEKLCAAAYNGSSCLELKPNDKLLCCLPLSHVFGFVCSWLWAWENGASVILSRGMKQIFFDFNYFKPTAVSLVPQMASFLATKKLFNKELQLVLIGAGDCQDEVLKLISSMGIRVSFGYGLTETSSGIALSIGNDPRAFTICPEDDVKLGEDNEILVKCPSTIFEGYYPDNSSYIDLFTEDGYFKTGDIGYIDNKNHLFLRGRKKDTLVLQDGTKIFLPEAEKELRNLLKVEELALGIDSLGNVVLCIGKISNSDIITYQDLISLYNEKVTRSQRITKVIALIEGLPKNQTGKIKRYEINFDK